MTDELDFSLSVLRDTKGIERQGERLDDLTTLQKNVHCQDPGQSHRIRPRTGSDLSSCRLVIPFVRIFRIVHLAETPVVENFSVSAKRMDMSISVVVESKW